MSIFGRRQENIHSYSADGSIAVVFVDKKHLCIQGDKLSKMDTDDITRRRGVRCMTSKLMRLIWTLQEVISRNSISIGAEDSSGEKSIPSRYFQNQAGQFREKVREFVEEVYNSLNELVGWIIYYQICDPSYSFEKNLEGMFFSCDREKKLRKKNTDKSVLDSRKEWIMNGLSPYLNDCFLFSGSSSLQAESTSLQEDNNPAQVTKCLCYEAVLDHLRDVDAKPVYMTPPFTDEIDDKHDDDNNEDEEESQETLLRVIRPLHRDLVPPNKFFQLDLRLFSKREFLTRELVSLLDSQPVSSKTTMEIARDVVASIPPDQMNTWRYSNEAQNMFESLLSKDEEAPGRQLHYKWMVDEINKSSDPFIVEENMEFMAGKNLSSFGNFLAYDVFVLENVMQTSTLHVEAIFSLIAMLGSGDISNDDLRLHVLFLGPAGSGKSFILKLIMLCRIKGTFIQVSDQTKKANTTDVNENALPMIIDELCNAYTNTTDDKTGDPILKQMLTEGVTRTETCVLVDGRRTKTMTVCHKKGSVFAGSNTPKYALAPAIVDRFYCCIVPFRNPAGKHVVLDSMMSNVNQKHEDAFIHLWKKRFLISSIYWTGQAAGFFPSIDMTVCTILMFEIFAEFEKRKIFIERRGSLRVSYFVKYLVVYAFVNRVIFLHGPSLREFKISHLNDALGELYATREMVIFAVSIMKSSFIDPYLKDVFESTLRYLSKRGGKDRFCKVAIMNGTTTYDFDYYIIDAGTHTRNSVRPVVVELIKQSLKVGDVTVSLSAENISDILMSQEAVTFTAPRYATEMDLKMPIEEITLPVLKWKTEGCQTGLCISRQYLDKIVSDTENAVDAVLKMVIDKFAPKHDYVFGDTFRDGYIVNEKKICVPYAFKTVKYVDNDKILRAINPLFKAKGFPELLEKKLAPAERPPLFLSINEDIDEMVRKRIQGSEPQQNYEWKYLGGEYPENIIDIM
jgi:hypothetical protein